MPLRPVRSFGLASVALIGLWLAAPLATALDRLDILTPGATDAISKAVREASLVNTMQADGQTAPQDLMAAARADYGRILAALYDKGHYSAVIHILVDGREVSAIPPLESPATISAIMIQVDPGPRFQFDRTQIKPLAPGTALPEGFSGGKPAESGLIGEAVDASLFAWRNVGHAKARVSDEQVVADHATALLDVDLRLSPGPKLRFGALAIEGEERMREGRVRKIAGLPEGEIFSETELRRAESRLRRTGIFSSVTLTEDEQITDPDLLGVTATVVEQKPRRYSFGAEIASLDGLSVEGSWLHRNLMGGGERLKVEGAATNIGSGQSGIDYMLGVSLDRPATITPDTTAGLSLTYAHLDETDYYVDGLQFGLNLVHVFSDKLTGKAGISFSYLQGSDPGGDFTYRNLSLPVSLSWDRRDDPRDAVRGFYLDASAMPFLGFGTTGSGIRGTVDGRVYRSGPAGARWGNCRLGPA